MLYILGHALHTNYPFSGELYSLQSNKFLDLINLNAFDDENKCDKKNKLGVGKGRKNCGKRRK